VKIGSVAPYEGNPRKIPMKAVEILAASIREFGWQQPLVVDKNMVIIIGHARLQAAYHLGLTEVPAVVAEGLTPEQVRALRIADNRTHDYTSWDYPLLMDELDGLDTEFADVLDLADWESIIREHEESQEEAGLGFSPEIAPFLASDYKLTVSFDSQESADRAAAMILDTIPGVVNVAYPGH
jgi:ParB-like chromosome segregation protein Spo0J